MHLSCREEEVEKQGIHTSINTKERDRTQWIVLEMRLQKFCNKIIYLTSYWMIAHSSFSKSALTNLSHKWPMPSISYYSIAVLSLGST